MTRLRGSTAGIAALRERSPLRLPTSSLRATPASGTQAAAAHVSQGGFTEACSMSHPITILAGARQPGLSSYNGASPITTQTPNAGTVGSFYDWLWRFQNAASS